MTLNGHFALKSGPSSASNGLAFWLSEKTVRKFADTVSGKKCSPAPVLLIQALWGYSLALPEDEASNQ